MVVFGACFTSLSNFFIVKYLKDAIDFEGIFAIGSAFTGVAIFLIVCFNEKLDVERLERLGHIEWITQKKVNTERKKLNQNNTEESGFEGG